MAGLEGYPQPERPLFLHEMGGQVWKIICARSPGEFGEDRAEFLVEDASDRQQGNWWMWESTLRSSLECGGRPEDHA